MIKEADLYQRTMFFEKIFSKSKMRTIFRTRPTLWPKEDYANQVKFLKSLGFINPEKMINLHPNILNCSDEKIKGIISLMKSFGFNRYIYLLERLPTLFGMSQESIQNKIENLESMGIRNYVKFIMSFPTVLNLSVVNIETKFKYLNRCYAVFNREVDIASLVESRPALLAYSYARLYLAFRFCAYKNYYPRVSLLSNILSDPAAKITQDDLQRCHSLRLAYFACYK